MSLDGRSAYDTMSRVSFLTALQAAAPEPVPSVRLFYGRPLTDPIVSGWVMAIAATSPKARAASKAIR